MVGDIVAAVADENTVAVAAFERSVVVAVAVAVAGDIVVYDSRWHERAQSESNSTKVIVSIAQREKAKVNKRTTTVARAAGRSERRRTGRIRR